MSEKDQGDRAGGAQLADFEGLARVYGEAMLRIGRLEERVEQLTAELRALHGQDSHGEAPAPSIFSGGPHRAASGDRWPQRRRHRGPPGPRRRAAAHAGPDGQPGEPACQHRRTPE